MGANRIVSRWLEHIRAMLGISSDSAYQEFIDTFYPGTWGLFGRIRRRRMNRTSFGSYWRGELIGSSGRGRLIVLVEKELFGVLFLRVSSGGSLLYLAAQIRGDSDSDLLYVYLTELGDRRTYICQYGVAVLEHGGSMQRLSGDYFAPDGTRCALTLERHG